MEFVKRYKIRDFDEYCQKNGFIPPAEIMGQELSLVLKGEDYISIPLSIIEKMKQEKTERDKWDELYKNISLLRLNAMQLERTDTAAAITEYEYCIETGETSTIPMFHAYHYAYERIIILLHKAKDYEKESTYIRQLLSHKELSQKEIEKYTERLKKLKS